MRRLWKLGLVAALGCDPPPAVEVPPRAGQTISASSASGSAQSAPLGQDRCLPVVAAECGCSYSCGVGHETAPSVYEVRHPFWGGTPLRARVDRYCANGACTDAFFGEIVCDGTCAPKPADATCHFEEGRCVGAEAPPPSPSASPTSAPSAAPSKDSWSARGVVDGRDVTLSCKTFGDRMVDPATALLWKSGRALVSCADGFTVTVEIDRVAGKGSASARVQIAATSPLCGVNNLDGGRGGVTISSFDAKARRLEAKFDLQWSKGCGSGPGHIEGTFDVALGVPATERQR